MRIALRLLLAWFSGAMILSGLWLNDELLTLAKYCGRDCAYAIPLLGAWAQYDAEGLGWLMVFVGVVSMFRACVE